MLKVEQEGERINKVLNEIESTLIHVNLKFGQKPVVSNSNLLQGLMENNIRNSF